MKENNIKITLVAPSSFIKEDGTLDLDKALIYSGQYAGVCYDEEGLDHLQKESLRKTFKRVETTLKNGHHSVYDHIRITLNIDNIPKILAMVLNNEHDYTTSEKSARYTPIKRLPNSIITLDEENLYNKWVNIFIAEITDKYGNIYNKNKILKLAQENARYLVTVLMPTKMVYTTSLRQYNYLASWMLQYINNYDKNNHLEYNLAIAMNEFIDALQDNNMLIKELMKNEKNRQLSLFGTNLANKTQYFNDISYSTIYQGSLAQLAQAQRHRTLYYQLELLEENNCYIPPIIQDDDTKVKEWLDDYDKVKELYPQGTLVNIHEKGFYDMFLLKCKERLCSNAQLEIMNQTKITLEKYRQALIEQNNPLANDIEQYCHGARCTFNDYNCSSDCHFNEGKTLTRKI